MDEKGLYELKTDITNLKKLHEQLESLHRQQTEKSNQTKTNVSLTEKELPGKVHECTSLYAQGIRNLREEFPKRAQSIETKIAACFDAAYFKELEIDQKIIALESKTSPYTLIDQTVAVLGLVREAQKYSLLNEITEGDYTDLLNLYRIALRNNNRTSLAFIEGRLEKLTREPSKNREDEAAKNALFDLVRRSVAKRLDPKVGELRDLFDTVINEHDCFIKDMDKDIKKPEVPQEQAGHETIKCVDGTEHFEGKREDRDNSAKLLMETPGEKGGDPGEIEMTELPEALEQRTETPMEPTKAAPEPPFETSDEQQAPPLELLEQQSGLPPEILDEQSAPPLEPPEKHLDLPLEPLEQPSGLVMETPAETLLPIAETRKDREDTAESLTEPPDEKIEDLGDLLLQAWTQALDKRPGSPAEGPEQQADPLLEDMQVHSWPPLEQAGQQEDPPLEQAEEHSGPPLEHAEHQEGPPLEPLEQQAELLLDSLDEQPEIVMESPAEALQPSAETREDPEDASKSLTEPPDEKKEDPGKILIRAWMETLGQQSDAPLENPEEQPGPPLLQLEQKADLQLEDRGALSDPPLEPPEQQADLPLDPLDEQPEIVMEPPAEVLQPSAETRENQKDPSETLVESPDENIEDLGKILVQEWMKNLEHKTETPSETPEEQTEITMKAPEEALKSTEETAKAREDTTEPPMGLPDERMEDLGKILVQEWMKILDQKPATPWTLPEEQAEQPSGIPGNELHPQEEKKEGTEQTTETLLGKPFETMDVSEALERIQHIERTETLGKLKPMDLTDALERITIIEKLRSLEKIHALPAKTKTPKKTAPKKRKKSPKKKRKRKKAKK